MPQYRYKARDRSGIPLTGVVQAEDPKAVSLSLRELGYQVILVEEFGGLAATLHRLQQRLQPHRPQEVVFFTRQLAMMVRSGLPLMEAVNGIAIQTRSIPFRKALILVVEDLKGGMSFSEALARHPRFFSNFFVSMIRAGEAAGIIDEILERLASVSEEELELRGRIQSALAYPCLLVFMSLSIITFLLVAVLPKFVGIFEEAGAKLPLPTAILLAISRFLSRLWFLVPVAAVGGFFLLRKYARTPMGLYRLHGWQLKVPILGPLIQKTILARFCRIMGALLKSGIQAVPALTITQEIVGNQVVRQALIHIREAVVGGANLADPFRVAQVFPPTLCQMISAGERTGSLDEILLHLSDFYDSEVDRDLRTLTSTLEPILLLTMGLFVGFIALSVLLPIFQLVRVFRR
ncbi:MAG: type II secretion system F family protein [Candidatus Omnitrophica bacterium]|nr:type II secretion system F family protein [Candidatus Omnitrophota bacterium]